MTGPTLVNVYLSPGDWRREEGLYDVRECELCGSVRPVRVWALPGWPMSVGGCLACWYLDCLPLWLVESFGDADMFGPNWRNVLHEQILDSHVFKDGDYVRIGDLP